MYNALEVVRQRHLEVIHHQRLLEAAIEEARERGASWADIGASLDVSKQAAQQRYGKTS